MQQLDLKFIIKFDKIFVKTKVHLSNVYVNRSERDVLISRVFIKLFPRGAYKFQIKGKVHYVFICGYNSKEKENANFSWRNSFDGSYIALKAFNHLFEYNLVKIGSSPRSLRDLKFQPIEYEEFVRISNLFLPEEETVKDKVRQAEAYCIFYNDMDLFETIPYKLRHEPSKLMEWYEKNLSFYKTDDGDYIMNFINKRNKRLISDLKYNESNKFAGTKHFIDLTYDFMKKEEEKHIIDKLEKVLVD